MTDNGSFARSDQLCLCGRKEAVLERYICWNGEWQDY